MDLSESQSLDRFKEKDRAHLQNKLRQPFNGLSHLAGAILSLIGMAYLIIKGWGDPLREASYVIYGISLMLMFSASAAYHLSTSSERGMLILRKLDHTAIYLLIAGTYTPICLIFFTGFWRQNLLWIIWLMALAGIIVKLFVIKAPRWVTAGIYLAMGWISVMAAGEMMRSMPPAALVWLLAGGLFYTIGALIYISKKMDFMPGVFGFHEVWHIFVMLGAASHFIVVALSTS
jgi:hemolysin III